MGQSAIGRCSAYGTEVVVAGGAQHVQLGLAATGVRATLDCLHQIVVHPYGNIVGVGVVVAEEGGVVANIITHLLEFRSSGVLEFRRMTSRTIV